MEKSLRKSLKYLFWNNKGVSKLGIMIRKMDIIYAKGFLKPMGHVIAEERMLFNQIVVM